MGPLRTWIMKLKSSFTSVITNDNVRRRGYLPLACEAHVSCLSRYPANETTTGIKNTYTVKFRKEAPSLFQLKGRFAGSFSENGGGGEEGEFCVSTSVEIENIV